MGAHEARTPTRGSHRRPSHWARLHRLRVHRCEREHSFERALPSSMFGNEDPLVVYSSMLYQRELHLQSTGGFRNRRPVRRERPLDAGLGHVVAHCAHVRHSPCAGASRSMWDPSGTDVRKTGHATDRSSKRVATRALRGMGRSMEGWLRGCGSKRNSEISCPCEIVRWWANDLPPTEGPIRVDHNTRQPGTHMVTLRGTRLPAPPPHSADSGKNRGLISSFLGRSPHA